jgi:hypothetical protein
MGVHGGVLGKLSAQILQFHLLVVAREGDTTTLPRGDALLQGGVVELAAAPQYLVQCPLLSGCGPQLLLVGLAAGRLIHKLTIPSRQREVGTGEDVWLKPPHASSLPLKLRESSGTARHTPDGARRRAAAYPGLS